MHVQDTERVVVTGVGITCPIGNDFDTVVDNLEKGESGIRRMEGWSEHEGLSSKVAGTVLDLDLHAILPRKVRRTMGRVAQLCAFASGKAIEAAGLESDYVRGGQVGLAMGSTVGSSAATLEWYRNALGPGGIRANKSTAFLKVMSHTCAANVALAHGITGRVWGSNSACTSSSQAIGLGYDTVRLGAQEVMICGGAEEAHYTTAAVFDLVSAASSAFNDRPMMTPRPFDKQRDGMVVGEGGGALVLERYDRAKARGATIYGEILGFATTCDGEHITTPAAAGMVSCMRRAMADSRLTASDIQYINAHATGTGIGDPAEAQATAEVVGDRVPISSTKGHVGHTLGGCGAIESIFVLGMMREGFAAPTLNLNEVDPSCEGPWHLQEPLRRPMEVAMSNNFAFGGINTTLIFRSGAS